MLVLSRPRVWLSGRWLRGFQGENLEMGGGDNLGWKGKLGSLLVKG